jgi:hypothetical protein
VNAPPRLSPAKGEGDALRRVAQRRILFGHQSVGGNVLDGLARLAREHSDAGLRIAAVESLPGAPAIAHLRIGQNERPLSKIAHFDDLMSKAPGDWAEVAFFKFCYVDFDAEREVRSLFESYQRAHEARKAQHARTIFVHLTAPLTRVERGPKKWIRNRVGSAAGGERENVKRNQYNELLRRDYAGREPLFDLARFEAAGAEGSFQRHGQRYESLASTYTDDGGHLNPTGQIAVASQLVAFLAALPAVAG